jgi:hypothetical protein
MPSTTKNSQRQKLQAEAKARKAERDAKAKEWRAMMDGIEIPDVERDEIVRQRRTACKASLLRAVKKAEALLPQEREWAEKAADKTQRRKHTRAVDRHRENLAMAHERARVYCGLRAETAQGKRVNAVVRAIESKGYDALWTSFDALVTDVWERSENWPAKASASKIAADIMAGFDLES